MPHSTTRAAAVLFALFLASGGVALADISSYDIFYAAYHYQSGPGAPPPSTDYRFTARIFSQPGDLTQARLARPFPFDALPPLILADLGGGLYQHTGPDTTTLAQTTNIYPAGLYTFAISGGTLGELSGPIDRLAALPVPSAVPIFDNDTVALLSGGPSTYGDLTLGFNSFDAAPNANLAITFLAVYQNNQAVYFTDLPSSDTSHTIPGCTLLANTPSQAVLFFSSRIQTNGAGLGAADSIFAYDTVTTFSFTTGPGRCSIADIAGGPNATCGDGTVDGSDFVAFINSFAIADVSVDPAADIAGAGQNGLQPDGTIDGSDFVAFINAFALGC